ncbi:hypothetical protein J1614_005986 [Plenodomus biglobosus]|nr:hypothetical protein J1614_005986 [Plenodomus biglobosus]
MTGTSGSGGVGEGIRKVVGKVHVSTHMGRKILERDTTNHCGLSKMCRICTNDGQGTGEAIRGKTLAALDDASGDRTAAAKNEAIANKGFDEYQHGYQGRARDAGVTPADTDAERSGAMPSTSTTHGTGAGSTNVGPHSTNVGNKLDPRFDSDADHRADPLSSVSGTGAVPGSTNVGTHSTNVGNKLDPRFDSDADHRANPGTAQPPTLSFKFVRLISTPGDESQPFHWPQHEHRGSIGGTSGLEAAQKIDPLYEPGQESMHYSALADIHQHRGSIGGVSGLHAAEKFDPPDTVRGPGFIQPDPFYHQPIAAHQSSMALGLLDVDSDSSESEETGHRSVTHTSPQYNDRFERQSHFPNTFESDMHVDPENALRRKSCKSSHRDHQTCPSHGPEKKGCDY